MSTAHEHEPNPEIEGLPIGNPLFARRYLAPESRRILELSRQLQRQSEENERLRYKAYHDLSTGLPDRTAFLETYDQVVGEAIAKREQIGLAIADIDGLKYTNDTFGHQVGDRLIKVVAGVLKNRSRPEDVVFRLGGDEFAIILPSYGANTLRGQTQEELDAATAFRYKTAIHKAIQRLGLPSDRVDVSIGVSTAKAEETPEDFFRRVDGILYSVKPRRDDDPRLRPIN